MTSCTDTCAGGGGTPEGLDLEADCRTLTSALPDGMVLPCLCAPDVSQFDAIAAGPIAPCVGCHPAFGEDSAYDEVVGRIADLLKVGESKLFCNAMGCSGHPGGDVWGGTGSCAWRTIAAWAVGAALPGEDCEDFDEAVSCVVQCGDEPPPEVDCDPGDHEDADDYCRFVAEVETKVIADCGLCHGTGSMGFSAKTGDSDANYAVALTKIDRDNPDDSTMLIKSTGGGGHPVRWSAEGCAFLATRAWIAKTEAPACLEAD